MYSQTIEMPKNMQEGLSNFVQMIINNIESGNEREALLIAVDLKNDIDDGIYQLEGDENKVKNINTNYPKVLIRKIQSLPVTYRDTNNWGWY